MRRVAIIGGVILSALIVLFLTGCIEETDPAKQRNASVESRSQTFDRAEKKYPLPRNENFPLREALVKFTERQDQINHPWFVYILADTGNIIGYYVAQTVPVNACNFLSSTEDVETQYEGTIVLTAPSLDGIYYGGGGASAGCDSWFFFDAATDALVQIRGVNFFTVDQPLKLLNEPVQFQVAE